MSPVTDPLFYDTGQVLLDWDDSSTNKATGAEMTEAPQDWDPLGQTPRELAQLDEENAACDSVTQHPCLSDWPPDAGPGTFWVAETRQNSPTGPKPSPGDPEQDERNP
ncbi:hypothetical protein Cadr_000024105 [Camelus dromedarius]|uniref:Uncharacterized protein n=1 Tax=Camelus dromedarius TaxID=9838 RepID=A0A5N4CX99_CAMDR|nr:hypothetical protein Cadr_000024105 [Camelus dromedarius]